MGKENKAHTATANRIARRYSASYNVGEGCDIRCDGFVIEVETTATLAEGFQRLNQCKDAAYVAVTNKEAIKDALQLAQGTRVGVMDPQGNILKPAGPE